ncbi:hypothetical protein X759_02730 [Mesorhizobium sp. LSHC420B00]|nr:hypothetical protein X759_02730 [Mesorhizobium sp. LSHC420B00]
MPRPQVDALTIEGDLRLPKSEPFGKAANPRCAIESHENVSVELRLCNKAELKNDRGFHGLAAIMRTNIPFALIGSSY